MPPAHVTLRPALASDLAAIFDIYNHYVIHSTCTFATEPVPPDLWPAWWEEHQGRTPAIVAVDGSGVVGWGSLSRWNTRCAYRFSVEDSVYVRAGRHGEGIGRALLDGLVSAARQHRHRSIIAQIADHQAPSESLHQRFGFRRVGCLECVGHKFDRWIDVVIWQLRLRYDDDNRPES
jgi:phosphinothricin acetyltransferase